MPVTNPLASTGGWYTSPPDMPGWSNANYKIGDPQRFKQQYAWGLESFPLYNEYVDYLREKALSGSDVGSESYSAWMKGQIESIPTKIQEKQKQLNSLSDYVSKTNLSQAAKDSINNRINGLKSEISDLTSSASTWGEAAIKSASITKPRWANTGGYYGYNPEATKLVAALDEEKLLEAIDPKTLKDIRKAFDKGKYGEKSWKDVLVDWNRFLFQPQDYLRMGLKGSPYTSMFTEYIGGQQPNQATTPAEPTQTLSAGSPITAPVTTPAATPAPVENTAAPAATNTLAKVTDPSTWLGTITGQNTTNSTRIRNPLGGEDWTASIFGGANKTRVASPFTASTRSVKAPFSNYSQMYNYQR